MTWEIGATACPQIYWSLYALEPSAIEIDGQKFFFLTLFRVLLGLSHILLSSIAPRSSLSNRVININTSLADGPISYRRRKLVDML